MSIGKCQNFVFPWKNKTRILMPDVGIFFGSVVRFVSANCHYVWQPALRRAAPTEVACGMEYLYGIYIPLLIYVGMYIYIYIMTMLLRMCVYITAYASKCVCDLSCCRCSCRYFYACICCFCCWCNDNET